MNETLSKLRGEHRQFLQIMAVLQQQLDSLTKTDTRFDNFPLVTDAVDYISSYPNQWHHPFEDIIFQRLRERTKANEIVLKRLEQEHKTIERLTQDLKQMFHDIASDFIMPIHQTVKTAEKFLKINYEHLYIEEDLVFPMCEACLTDDDWWEIKAKFEEIPDPVFGEKPDARFASLYEHSIQFALPANVNEPLVNLPMVQPNSH